MKPSSMQQCKDDGFFAVFHYDSFL